MLSSDMKRIRGYVNQALARNLLVERDDGWLTRMVDSPRFGWDWEALDEGFFQPLNEFAAKNPMRLRPILAGLLIEALGKSSQPHSDLLAALELQHLASIMLDDLRNGRDLSESASPFVTVPIPTWVTIAYNVRQLVPVMIRRQSTVYDPSLYRWLSMRFSRYLFKQGLGSALDMAGSEQAYVHNNEHDFLNHMRLYVGSLSFGLACDVASAVHGFDEQTAETLRRAGVELGVALRLFAMAEAENRSLYVGRAKSVEQFVRWDAGIDSERLEALARQSMERAFTMANLTGTVVSDVFCSFSSVFERRIGRR